MAIEVNGKRPNKLWYAAHYAAGMVKSLADPTARPDGLNFLKNSGIALGTLALSFSVVAPLVASIYLAPVIVTLAGSAVAFHFAWNKARFDFMRVRDSGCVYDFVSRREKKWAARQKAPSLVQRITARFNRAATAPVQQAPAKPFRPSKDVFEIETAPSKPAGSVNVPPAPGPRPPAPRL